MLQFYCKETKSASKLPIVVGIFVDEVNITNQELVPLVEELKEKKQISFEAGVVNKIYTFGKVPNEIVFLVGQGERNKHTKDNLVKSIKKVSNSLKDEVLIDVKSFTGDLCQEEVVSLFVEEIHYNNYSFDHHFNEKKEKDLNIGFLTEKDFMPVIKAAMNIGVAVSNTRDLVNEPYNFMKAEDLANYAQELVETLNKDTVSIKIYEKEEIEKMNMGAFLAVNMGSTAPPKLIHIKYQPVEGKSLGLVGKGVMYDTGGYSIKTSMNGMKSDMAGAATALGVLEAVVKNDVKVNLQVIICATDNRINGHALLPDDIVKAMNGKTIEILSTDAEGRLTLADGLYFAQQEGCNKVIDIATLTGAVVVALGETVTGLFGNDEEEQQKMITASKKAMEEFWVLPINDSIREKVKSSKVADLKNSTGRYMGASGAAAFLEEFINEGTKWLHLDIAGTAFSDSSGATAASLKTIYEYLKK